MTNYPSLFEQFLREECTPEVRRLIMDATTHRDPGRLRREFEFNRFDLELDFERGVATIQDVTDASEKGSISVALSNLVEGIRGLDR